MDLINEYKAALKGLEKINNEESAATKDANILTRKAQEDYNLAEQELRNKLNQSVRTAEETLAQKKTALEDQRKELRKTTALVNKIMKLIDIIKDPNTELTPPEIYYYSEWDVLSQGKRKVQVEPIKSLLNNKYVIANLYIVPNGKPTNKYSLIIRGYHIFGDLIQRNFKDTLNRICYTSCNLSYTVKEAPTQEELQVYLNNPKNLSKIIHMIPDELGTLEVLYQEALELIKDINWQIFYLEYRKNYYEKNYTRGTETPEYAAVLKELKQLRKQVS